MTGYDRSSFAAGQDVGTRVAACLARSTALELVDGARWWNRWKRRLMARALLACAEELECAADAERRSSRSRAREEDDDGGEPLERVPFDRPARGNGLPRAGAPVFRWAAP